MLVIIIKLNEIFNLIRNNQIAEEIIKQFLNKKPAKRYLKTFYSHINKELNKGD